MSEKRTAHPLIALLGVLAVLAAIVFFFLGVPLLIGVACRWAGLEDFSPVQIFLQVISPLVVLMVAALLWGGFDERFGKPRRFKRWTARVEADEPGVIPELIDELISKLHAGDADTLWAVLEPRLGQFGAEKASAARSAWAARKKAIASEVGIVGPAWGLMDSSAALEKTLKALVETRAEKAN